MLNFKESKISKAIFIEKIFPSSLLKFLKILFFLIFILFLLFYIFWNPFSFNKEKSLAISLIFFSLAGIFWIFSAFINQKIKKPDVKESENIADFLDISAAKVIIKALSFRKYSFNLSLFLILIGIEDLRFTFSRFLLSQEKIYKITEDLWKREGIDEGDSLKDAEKTIEEALKITFLQDEEKISVFHLLSALIANDVLVGKILAKISIAKNDVLDTILWQERLLKSQKDRKKFWLRRNLLRKRGLGRDWTAGYTPFLDLYSKDITDIVKSSLSPEIILHRKEIAQLEDVLVKSGDNCALLVGEPGVGRKTMIVNLANKILEEKSYTSLNFNRIIEIDMASLFSASEKTDELEVNLQRIFNEATQAENVILIINELHNYIGSYDQDQQVAKVDISGILSEYIAYPTFRLIGITTPEGFYKSLNQAREVVSRFVKIEIPPATIQESLLVLQENVLQQEKRSGLLITFPAIKEIINIADRYIGDVPFPKKAIDILDEVVINKIRRSTGDPKVVSADEVADFISEKIDIPVGEVGEREKEMLLNLEEIIHEKLINQEEAVSEIANALRRARTDITTKKRTLGNFLFLGPTGVGKTETAKSLARVYFGNEKRMIRLDMSEYQEEDSISRLIGTEKEGGYFTTMVREDPFSLILLDEIEKADKDVLNLFLQVLDEGHLTDGMGRMVDFKNTIIIATSNAGAELIRNAIKEGRNFQEYKKEFINEILKQGIFRPEFLNRFDAVVIFKTLSKEDLQKVAKIMLSDIKEGLYIKEIEFKITPELTEKIVELGFNPEFGAREMKRVIQEKVENAIAKAILAGKVKAGDKIEIDPQSFEVKLY